MPERHMFISTSLTFSTAQQHSTIVYLHDMTANIITREISQKNHANKVLKEVEGHMKISRRNAITML